MKIIALFIFLTGATCFVQAQLLHPVKWSYAAKRISSTEGVVFFKAQIDDGWHIYAQQLPEGGPVKTTINFTPSKYYKTEGKVKEPIPLRKYEFTFKMKVQYFEHQVVFQQKIRFKTASGTVVSGTLQYMTCNNSQCLPPDNLEFNIHVNK